MPLINLLFILSFHLLISTAEITVPSDGMLVFSLDSLEIQSLPRCIGLTEGKTGIILRIDTAIFDRATQWVHLRGCLWEEQDQIGISSYTVGLARLEQKGNSFLMISRLQVLSDAEGRFSLQAGIKEDDILFISWSRYLFKLYRIGSLIHTASREQYP